MIAEKYFSGEDLNAPTPECIRNMDLFGAEFLFLGKPDHHLPQASWKMEENNHRILFSRGILREVIPKANK